MRVSKVHILGDDSADYCIVGLLLRHILNRNFNSDFEYARNLTLA